MLEFSGSHASVCLVYRRACSLDIPVQDTKTYCPQQDPLPLNIAPNRVGWTPFLGYAVFKDLGSQHLHTMRLKFSKRAGFSDHSFLPESTARHSKVHARPPSIMGCRFGPQYLDLCLGQIRNLEHEVLRQVWAAARNGLTDVPHQSFDTHLNNSLDSLVFWAKCFKHARFAVHLIKPPELLVKVKGDHDSAFNGWSLLTNHEFP